MRRSIASLFIVALSCFAAPAAASAHTGALPAASSASPGTPTPTPTAGSGGGAGVVLAPEPDSSSSWTEPLTVVGFSIVAMAGLVLIIRAGMRATDDQDVD